tara:strand:- start:25 stop:225 length:201 start_codon:yes stop_codon:yes gene_type:complete
LVEAVAVAVLAATVAVAVLGMVQLVLVLAAVLQILVAQRQLPEQQILVAVAGLILGAVVVLVVQAL